MNYETKNYIDQQLRQLKFELQSEITQVKNETRQIRQDLINKGNNISNIEHNLLKDIENRVNDNEVSINVLGDKII